VELARVLEHRTSRSGRWLRENRLRIALGIAIVEGAAVAFDAVSGWIAFAIALAVIAFYFAVGRNVVSDTLRQVSWTAALSQVLVMLVPLVLLVVSVAALIAIGILAVVALVALVADRR
jgi:predicted regulator of amino acid metabolism with ACT domain